MTRPLLVTADPLALDDLLRLAATAGVEVDVAGDALAARRTWGTAPLVVVAADQLPGCAAARLGRRSGVVALADGCHDDGAVWRQAVDVGAERVLLLPEAEPWLVQAFAEALEGTGRAGLVVGVLGGRGGAGATALAVALARSGAHRELQALLVDADPLGGGVDLVLGAEGVPGLRWPDLAATRGRLPAAVVTEALPQHDGLAVLSWDRDDVRDLSPEAVEAVLEAGRRACDLVVVDLPRAVDGLAREALAASTCALLVVPAEVRATAAAAQVAARAALLCPDLRLVVRGPSPANLPATEVQRALGLPLAGELRPEPHLDAHLEQGRPPGSRSRSPLRGFCDALLDDLLPRERAA